MSKRPLVLMLALSCGLTLCAQAPKFSNDFLNIGVGARAHAMSGSVMTSVDDVTASYWNSAALSNVEAPFQIGAMHAEWFAGIGKYDFMSIGKSFNEDRSSFGSLSVIRMAIDQIPNTLRLREPDGSLNYDAIEEFSIADYAFLLSYGQRLGESPWKVGGSVKVIHRTVGTFAKAWGFGMDLGVQANWSRWRLGVNVRDVTSTFNAWTFSFSEEEKEVFTQTNNDIPQEAIESTLPTAHIGLGYYLPVSAKFDILAELGMVASTNGTESSIIGGNHFVVDPSFGLEFSYDRVVFIRGGVGNFQELTNNIDGLSTEMEFEPSIGIGLKLGNLKIDYAFTNIGNVSTVNSSHIFSATLNFVRRDSGVSME